MSSRPTFVSLFSGGGGADIGAQAAGFEIAGALEREAKIAEVYAANFGHFPIIDSIENVQPCQFDAAPDWLHGSPPCQGYSLARSGIPTPHADIDAGLEVCRFIKAWKPKFFTLENVIGYRRSESLWTIENCLRECGYWYNRLTLDASDYDIPQSRVRLWVIAWRPDEVAPLVLPNPSAKKRGWYEAIEDLIPTLKESKLSPWQVAKFQGRMPETSELIASSNSSSAVHRGMDEPAMTVCGQKSGAPKIYLVNGQDSKTPIRESPRPSATVKASAHKSMPKIVQPEIVLATTPRCAARFQTFPDNYQLPENIHLAGAIIGNAVPCKLAELIGKSLIAGAGR